MFYEVYWRITEKRDAVHGYVKAESHDQAYDIARKNLAKECNITAVYRVDDSRITPQSITFNFPNNSSYELF